MLKLKNPIVRHAVLLLLAQSVMVPAAWATTPLADRPIFTGTSMPGNLSLVLSVEFPTAVSVAHTNRTYASANEYLGYFDPDKCYRYKYAGDGTTIDNYFVPVSNTPNHLCTTSAGRWSGNFLNWASMQTIDTFRWALTGGYRAVDNTNLTVLEKSWGSGQGGTSNFPDASTSGAELPGATPFLTTDKLWIKVEGQGNKMKMMLQSSGNGTPDMTKPTVAYNPAANPTATFGFARSTSFYNVFARVKVCAQPPSGGSATTDPASSWVADDGLVEGGSAEVNCVAYGSNSKPEGLIQKYAHTIRYSAFGYLNDDELLRDGGVLRARQKFVGPKIYIPNSVPTSNPAKEWDTLTGQFIANPDPADASAMGSGGLAHFGSVSNSGVINYLNKFGQTKQKYKKYDNVNELYYAAVRYFANKGNVPEWYANRAGSTAAQGADWADSFPVIQTWDDPVQYSCQKNYLLGIGDVNTHADKNLPGSTSTSNEPPKPSSVSADVDFNAVTSTNKVGALESLESGSSVSGSLGSYVYGNGSAVLMAGLAYYAHTQDMRPLDFKDGTTPKDRSQWTTLNTYWVDVMEYQNYKSDNKFYLAAKYGGFKVPNDFDRDARSTKLEESWWHAPSLSSSGTDTNLISSSSGGSQRRPNNLYSGAQPDLMKKGLEAAFVDIASDIESFTTSSTTSLPQVTSAGNKGYSSNYNAETWTGELKATELKFVDNKTDPTKSDKWSFTKELANQLADTGWSTNRRVVTWNPSSSAGVPFRLANLSITQKDALKTGYAGSTVDDSQNFLNYLRGERKNEQNSTVADGTKSYRSRGELLGDIVGSKLKPIGQPAYPFSDSRNAGYSNFKSAWASRPTVVYVGSNDGMMHAVHGSLDTTASGGKELFSYIPSDLFSGTTSPLVDGLAALGKPAYAHKYYVNSTPNVFDIDMSRTAGSTSSTPSWSTILIGGLGKGGKSYYAIDVTDPIGMSSSESAVASKVLWEFKNPDLGYTFGDPVVVKTLKYGWVVIFPSGYNNASGQGHFFMVNPRNGQLLAQGSTGVGSPTSSAGLATANAFVLDSSDGVADAVYGGDLKGNLWRWDITSSTGSYPAPTKMASVTNGSGVGQPITTRPLIEIHPQTKKRYVMFGTGRFLDNSDLGDSQIQAYYSIVDGSNRRFNKSSNLPSGITFPITRDNLVVNSNPLEGVSVDWTTKMGWYIDLGKDSATNVGWRVTLDSASFYGTVAFSSLLTTGSVCKPDGKSRVYGVDYDTGKSQVGTLVATPAGPKKFEANAFVEGVGTITDLRFLSVNGKPALIAGNNDNKDSSVGLSPLGGKTIRRLNWRELQIVN
jgi:type IV pilus assembly protein PilY1